jgi:fatty acid desaturase
MTRRLAEGVWEFVVGDDWRVALAVVAALAATAGVAALGLAAWWVLPLATLAILHLAVRSAAAPRNAGRGSPSPSRSPSRLQH